MSTVVDKGRARKPRVPAHETRERVLQAARRIFSGAGFDQVGVREIAQAAGIDPAMVIRLFGSKEALFTQVAETAFDLEPAFAGQLDRLGEAIAHLLMQPLPQEADPQEFDEFQFLLRSAASIVAGPILSASLHARLVRPLAGRFEGEQAEARAALITAYVLGFATLRFALTSPAVEKSDHRFLIAKLAAAIQGCVEGSDVATG